MTNLILPMNALMNLLQAKCKAGTTSLEFVFFGQVADNYIYVNPIRVMARFRVRVRVRVSRGRLQCNPNHRPKLNPNPCVNLNSKSHFKLNPHYLVNLQPIPCFNLNPNLP